jgi:hypothetical protein
VAQGDKKCFESRCDNWIALSMSRRRRLPSEPKLCFSEKKLVQFQKIKHQPDQEPQNILNIRAKVAEMLLSLKAGPVRRPIGGLLQRQLDFLELPYLISFGKIHLRPINLFLTDVQRANQTIHSCILDLWNSPFRANIFIKAEADEFPVTLLYEAVNVCRQNGLIFDLTMIILGYYYLDVRKVLKFFGSDSSGWDQWVPTETLIRTRD